MESYHTTNSPSSGGYSDTSVRINPYAYTIVPPIGRLLTAIADHCGVGGTIRPRNRQLADWAQYASAGHISPLLDQLASDGWILYDRSTGLITLLFDPAADQMIPDGIDSETADDSALIPTRDRFSAQQDAEYNSDPASDQNAQCMEDHVLAAAAVDSDSAAARYKIPCGADSIPPLDHRAVLLAELGADAKIIADALANRPDLTLAQIRASWSHFEPRIRAGLCTAGAFFAAIRRGQLHAPPDKQRPLDPESYAADPAYRLGSQAEPDESARRNAAYRDAHWRAVDLLGPGAAFGAMRIVVEALVSGATDDQALAELAAERRAPL